MKVLILLILVFSTLAYAATPATRPVNSAGLEVLEQRIPNTTVSFKLVKLPAGSIEMPALKEGEKPRRVEVKAFWMGETEVTWEEYDVWFLGLDIDIKRGEAAGVTHPSEKPYQDLTWGFGHSGLPAMAASAHGATMYCRWLSSRTGRTFRLPTEAEWEYACRAGRPATTLDSESLKKVAWFRENSGENEDERRPHEVRTKPANEWGLFDTLGNVAEWVRTDDGPMVVKGGSYLDPAKLVQSTARKADDPKWNFRDPRLPKGKWYLTDAPHVGFRVVMEE